MFGFWMSAAVAALVGLAEFRHLTCVKTGAWPSSMLPAEGLKVGCNRNWACAQLSS